MPAALYQRWLHANEDCRSGAGDSADTVATCDYRNTLDRRMAAAGWRYPMNMEWHRCKR